VVSGVRRINEVTLRRALLILGGHVGEGKCPGQTVSVLSRLWHTEHTRSSAIAKGPHDASCQLKSC